MTDHNLVLIASQIAVRKVLSDNILNINSITMYWALISKCNASYALINLPRSLMRVDAVHWALLIDARSSRWWIVGVFEAQRTSLRLPSCDPLRMSCGDGYNVIVFWGCCCSCCTRRQMSQPSLGVKAVQTIETQI